MKVKNWADEEVEFNVRLATTGDTLENGTRVDHPFDPGGPGGVPSTWSQYMLNATNWADVNVTTSQGRFSISNALGGAQVNYYYGATRTFAVTVGRKYVITLQARTMQDKGAAGRRLRAIALPSGTSLGGFARVSQPDWETLSLPISSLPAGTTSIEVRIYAAFESIYPANSQAPNWGVQFQNLSILEVTTPIPQPVWRDITCDVKAVTMRYGRERFTNRFEVGNFSVVLNNDHGLYTYRSNHPFGFRPGRFIQGRAEPPGYGDFISMFYGIIDNITDGYTLDGRAIVTLSILDQSSLLSNMQVPTIAADPNFTQLSSARVSYLLAAAGYPNAFIQTGKYIQQAILANGRSIRDEIGVTADSEGGSFYAGRDQYLEFKNRDWITTDNNLIKVGANLVCMPWDGGPLPDVDDIPDQSTGIPVICPHEFTTNWSRDRVVNIVQLANQGGSAFLFENDASQKAYGPATYERTDFVNDNAHPEYLTQRASDIMTGYAEPRLRVNSVTFRPGGSFAHWWWTITSFLNWLVRVYYMHPLNYWGFAATTHIQSIEHRLSPTDWETTLTLDQPASFAEWEGSPSGRGWDISEWDTDDWDG